MKKAWLWFLPMLLLLCSCTEAPKPSPSITVRLQQTVLISGCAHGEIRVKFTRVYATNLGVAGDRIWADLEFEGGDRQEGVAADPGFISCESGFQKGVIFELNKEDHTLVLQGVGGITAEVID